MMGLCRRNIRYPRGASAPWDMPELCRVYGVPQGIKGPRVRIGIVELGGGWKSSDMTTAFGTWKLAAPNVTNINVGGGSNAPGGDADGEVVSDIQVAGAVWAYGTGEPADINVYFGGNTDQEFMDACARMVAECDVGSISWGAPESSYGQSLAQQFDGIFAKGTDNGCNTCVASGDNDSGDGGSGKNVDFPASSPHVLGVGGTRKSPTAESVWNDGVNGTGGGFSKWFARPAWQTPISGGSTRSVPDLAALADPATGYRIYLDGQWTVIGGTSLAAPLWAGLIALTDRAARNAGRKKMGDIRSWLWSHPTVMQDIQVGNNGAFNAAAGPDCCTGLGVPIGVSFINAVLDTVGPPPPPPPFKPPEPPVSSMILTGTVKIPFLGSAPMTGVITPGGSAAVDKCPDCGYAPGERGAVAPKGIPPVILDTLKQYVLEYGQVVLDVLAKDALPLLLRRKKWADVLNDIKVAVGLAV